MGNGMNKILPNLYLGNFRDARDIAQLSKNNITHILSIHDNAKAHLSDKKYLCIEASDSATQDLSQYFTQCVDFIHDARLNGGGVLVHCLAGVSRSVTITVVYVMIVTDLGWREALNAVRGSRTCASPNFGFQRQLNEFETSGRLLEERARFQSIHPPCPFDDKEECKNLLVANIEFVKTGRLPSTEYGIDDIYKDKNSASNQTTTDASASAKNPVDCASKWADVDEASAKDGLDLDRKNGLSNGACGGAAENLEKLSLDESNKSKKNIDVSNATLEVSNFDGSIAEKSKVNDDNAAPRSKILTAWVTLNSPQESSDSKK